MTSIPDEIELIENPRNFWDQRVKASRWMITKTLMLGALAAALGVLGQGWLEDASPLFPFISQNYGIWQAGYLLALIFIFLLWAAAMLQKIGLLQNSKQGKKMQERIDEQNERRKAKEQADRERRAQEQLDHESVASFFKLKGNTHSNKFDY